MRNRSIWLAAAGVTALSACTDPTAALRGREGYHAIGHEPGWLLTMENDRLEFVTSSPRTRIETLRPIAQPTAAGSRYLAGGLTLDVTHQPCNDSRSGIGFADTVMVVVGGYSYRGCGGERVPLLDR